jgi:competence protein ComEC
LRLRPPRGLVNPAALDGERGAVLRGVVAVGYVRIGGQSRPLAAAGGPCIDAWRQEIAAAIAQRFEHAQSSGLLRALAVGDQQAIADADWQVLRATGISHLIAISGLHVGMFAAFGALLARLAWKAWPRLALRIPGPLLEAPVAMACAFGYGLLAGMGVPTIRTLLMIAIALLARYARRASSVAQALALRPPPSSSGIRWRCSRRASGCPLPVSPSCSPRPGRLARNRSCGGNCRACNWC